MTSEPLPTQSGSVRQQPERIIDPHGFLRSGMRVSGGQGKAIGKISALEHDATEHVVALVVQHGLIRRNRTRIPVTEVKQVNQDSVVLKLTRAQFQKLPTMAKGN